MKTEAALTMEYISILILFVCIQVSEQCACFVGYHCCDEDLKTCCPDGFFCAGGDVCINIIVVVIPVILAVIAIITTVVVCIICKKKSARGVVIAPQRNGQVTTIQQNSANYYGQPMQPMTYGNPAYQPPYGYQPPPQQPRPMYDVPPPGVPEPPAYVPMAATAGDPVYPPPQFNPAAGSTTAPWPGSNELPPKH